VRLALMSDAVWPTPWDGGHGLGRMVFNLGRELVRRGHEVTLLGAAGSALDGARVWTVPAGQGFAYEPQMARMVLDNLADFDAFIDASHTHALANARRGLPGLAWFADVASAPAPCAVFVSRWAQEKLGLPGKVIYNAVEPDEFPLYQGTRAGLLWMALNVPAKGLSVARIAAQLAELPLSAHGPRTDAGPLSGAAKVAALQTAQAYLFPSTIDAGPQTPLEAMACGTPCVALMRAGTVEYVMHGVGGYLCADVSEMARACHRTAELDPASVRQSVINGGFTVPRQADQFEGLLARVCAGEVW
jgi:hypothetical protein